MNRRLFLTTSLIAAATLDPEQLLWIPGRKTINIPNRMEIACFNKMIFYPIRNKDGVLTSHIEYFTRFNKGPWITNTITAEQARSRMIVPTQHPMQVAYEEIAGHLLRGAEVVAG